MPAPVTTALAIVEDAVLAALRAIGGTVPTPAPTSAWWNGEVPQGTAARLNPDAPTHIARFFVAQHQDGGGEGDPLVNSAGWRGLVAVRCLSRTKATARAGLELAVAAMGALESPEGHALHARWVRPVAVPADGAVLTAAGLWELRLRRVNVEAVEALLGGVIDAGTDDFEYYELPAAV